MKFSLFAHMERIDDSQPHELLHEQFIELCRMADGGGMRAISKSTTDESGTEGVSVIAASSADASTFAALVIAIAVSAELSIVADVVGELDAPEVVDAAVEGDGDVGTSSSFKRAMPPSRSSSGKPMSISSSPLAVW